MGGDTRRLNFTQGMRKVLDEMTGPLSTDEIILKLEDLTELSVDGPIAGLIISEGGKYDSVIKKWNSIKKV